MPAATVPQHAALLRDFANTLDVDEGTDALSSTEGLTGWLREHDLLGEGAPAGDDDLVLARLLRDAFRAAFRANHGDTGDTDTGDIDTDDTGDARDPRDPGEAMHQVAARLPLTLRLSDGRPTLVPVESGVRGALTRLLAAAAECDADSSWTRLKICAADDCAWAFYDTSKNRSKTWCSMQVCGNRAKTRSYRARRAPAS